MPRFDGYVATTKAARYDDLIPLLWSGVADDIRPGRGYLRWEHKHAVIDSAGDEVGSVLHGGQAHGDLVMFEVKGERTPEAVDRFRKLVPEHRCTRVDSCEDLEGPGMWEQLLETVLDVKAKYRLHGKPDGDWDFPEEGRTQYLGSPSSTVRTRLYEKGKQKGYRHLERPNWVRLEVQVRPEKAAKSTYSSAGPLDVWGASPYTRELAARVLEAQVGRLPAGTVWKRTQRDETIAWMCQQYGGHLVSLCGDLGDWQSVGLTLGEVILEQQRRKRQGGGLE